MTEKRSWENRKKFLEGKNSFFILKVLNLLRHYKQKHAQALNAQACDCILCVEATKLLDEADKAMKKK